MLDTTDVPRDETRLDESERRSRVNEALPDLCRCGRSKSSGLLGTWYLNDEPRAQLPPDLVAL